MAVIKMSYTLEWEGRKETIPDSLVATLHEKQYLKFQASHHCFTRLLLGKSSQNCSISSSSGLSELKNLREMEIAKSFKKQVDAKASWFEEEKEKKKQSLWQRPLCQSLWRLIVVARSSRLASLPKSTPPEVTCTF